LQSYSSMNGQPETDAGISGNHPSDHSGPDLLDHRVHDARRRHRDGIAGPVDPLMWDLHLRDIPRDLAGCIDLSHR
ncbi:hypothetical protein ACFVW2_35200, partial [Streptomyces sp. NPDC058171]